MGVLVNCVIATEVFCLCVETVDIGFKHGGYLEKPEGIYGRFTAFYFAVCLLRNAELRGNVLLGKVLLFAAMFNTCSYGLHNG